MLTCTLVAFGAGVARNNFTNKFVANERRRYAFGCRRVRCIKCVAGCCNGFGGYTNNYIITTTTISSNYNDNNNNKYNSKNYKNKTVKCASKTLAVACHLPLPFWTLGWCDYTILGAI